MTTSEDLRVVVFRPGAEPVVETIAHGLDAMVGLVGGHIDVIHLRRDIDIWVNDSFLYDEACAPNRQVGPRTTICGTFFVAGHDGRGETLSLTDEQVTAVLSVALQWRPVTERPPIPPIVVTTWE